LFALMVNAAAAAGKRKVPAASYVEADGDGSDDEYVEQAAKKAKTPVTSTAQKSKSVAPPSAKKPKAPSAAAEAKATAAKLAVLDRAQLQALLKSLLEAGSVLPAEVESLLPAPDMSAYTKEGERLCNAIRRALPNSRWGSCTDHYGYKRCASAANAAKKYIVDHAKVFKSSKQWPAALEYANAMLPVANGMVEFDLAADCKARDAAIGALTSLKAEAMGKMGIAAASSSALVD